MFSVLCILLGSFQFAFLLLVTGLLLSLAIVSRLMEVVVTLVHPTTVFLLRQSVKLFVLLTTLAAKTTGYALSKIIVGLREFPVKEGPMEIDLRSPPVMYERALLPGGLQYDSPLVPDVPEYDYTSPN